MSDLGQHGKKMHWFGLLFSPCSGDMICGDSIWRRSDVKAWCKNCHRLLSGIFAGCRCAKPGYEPQRANLRVSMHRVSRTRGMTQASVEASFGRTANHPSGSWRPTDYALGIRRFHCLLRARQGHSRRFQIVGWRPLRRRMQGKYRARVMLMARFCA